MSFRFNKTQILIIRLKVLKKLAGGSSQNEVPPKVMLMYRVRLKIGNPGFIIRPLKSRETQNSIFINKFSQKVVKSSNNTVKTAKKAEISQKLG